MLLVTETNQYADTHRIASAVDSSFHRGNECLCGYPHNHRHSKITMFRNALEQAAPPHFNSWCF